MHSHADCERLLGDVTFMRLDKIVDDQGLSLLHHAVLNGDTNKVEFLLDWAKNRHPIRMSESEIIAWVNMATLDEEWTALHYASFTSNLIATYELIRAGGDVHALNANKLNMLHVAA